MDRRPRPLAVRFWEKVKKSKGCWLWLGYKNPKGYGHISKDGHVTGAHRVSWELHFGPRPSGLLVLHKCDNPPCVRPSHLFLGTHLDNSRDKQKKGRGNIGEKNGLAKLTAANVKRIRVLNERGYSQRKMAQEFNVTQATVSRAASGVHWKHL